MQARIEEDLKSAMKRGDKRRVATLRLMLAGLKNEKIQAQRALTDEEIESVLRRAVKQRKDSIEQYARGGRQDLVEAETEELAILEEYLPKGLSDAEIEAALRSVIAEKGFASQKDVGLAMKELMARHKGRVDGKRPRKPRDACSRDREVPLGLPRGGRGQGASPGPRPGARASPGIRRRPSSARARGVQLPLRRRRAQALRQRPHRAPAPGGGLHDPDLQRPGPLRGRREGPRRAGSRRLG